MRKLIPFLLIISLVINIGLGFFLFTKGQTKETTRPEELQYPYLSKRIFVENQNDILINFMPLREAMNTHIPKMKVPVGVYFEYLPSGSSIGVNEKMEVKLASLIKVPIVMAVYKQIAEGTIKKDQILTLKKESFDTGYGTLWERGEGAQITVAEAINLALTESDNTAANILTSILPADSLDNVFNWLDIPKTKESNFPIISPKNYSSILRSLYLSSFLPENFSNEILDTLSRTKFSDKLPAGVPEDVKVSHKIGVFRPLGASENEQVFSDCGIVYVPNRPYALCIMVVGNEEYAREYIQFISKMVYGFITKTNTKKVTFGL